jgi:hypothetical protein
MLRVYTTSGVSLLLAACATLLQTEQPIISVHYDL